METSDKKIGFWGRGEILDTSGGGVRYMEEEHVAE